MPWVNAAAVTCCNKTERAIKVVPLRSYSRCKSCSDFVRTVGAMLVGWSLKGKMFQSSLYLEITVCEHVWKCKLWGPETLCCSCKFNCCLVTMLELLHILRRKHLRVIRLWVPIGCWGSKLHTCQMLLHVAITYPLVTVFMGPEKTDTLHLNLCFNVRCSWPHPFWSQKLWSSIIKHTHQSCTSNGQHWSL